MPVSDALLVGEDWISEHYFTTDATKESFQGRVIERRKEWDASEDGQATTRSRFTTARADIESRLIALGEERDEGSEAALYDLLTSVLGYTTGQWRLTSRGPLTGVSAPEAELADEVTNAPLVIIEAKGAATVDDLLAKHADTLPTPWEREDEDSITSVATALSTLMTDADGPAFALVLAGRWALVAEKERWPEGRWLAIDLQLICERNDTKRGGEVDRALTCLEAQSLAPDASGGIWWAETLEASIKHTVGVSKDLQDGVRESIEIIANEVVRRRRVQGLDPLHDDQAQVLAVQSLRYLYRILFLLYAEASPELGVLPVGAEEYDAGYGIDRLRDLALTDIHTRRARTGTHLYASLESLFRLVDRGHTPDGDASLPQGLEFNALRADLFAPSATNHINEVRLGNEALLQVLRKLLLSKEQGSKQRGFISYVELGINQLGAVYEGLMSYTGSFSNEDLYEVAKNGDPSDGSWVVPISRSDHLDPSHFVRRVDEETGEERPVMYQQGEFVFRLSGRDRQRSASFYTPEVLTRFTVQQALEELLDQDGTTTTAEEVLGLTICEPALGSGAFAIEAVRQLAEDYIARREVELGEKVDPDLRPQEVQKAKAHVALHQVYGVDLNSTAVELAEVSLWLDTMVRGLQAPWFGLRLRQGNSLVGARRAVYTERQIKDRTWLTTPAQEVDLSGLAGAIDQGRDRDPTITDTRVHHFLLPAQGWGSASEVPKSVRDLVPEERIKGIKTWRRSLRRKPSPKDLKRLSILAQRVEALWGGTLRRLRIAEEESSRAINLWGRETDHSRHAVSREEIETSLADEDGAYRRLRLVMNAWCALWYWPLTDVGAEPPTMEQWLSACEQILGRVAASERSGMNALATASNWGELGQAEELDLQFAGAESIGRVRDEHPWIRVCEEIAAEQAFFHWELDFATVFAQGGFDLQVGNPPWVRPRTDVESLLAEGDPWWSLAHKPSEEAKAERRATTLALTGVAEGVVSGTTEVVVLAEILSDPAVYPILSGQPDLYRGFMSQVWDNASRNGISALIHLESHLTDVKATSLRRATYRHLRRHWQFINELKLFEIQDQKAFGVNVYGRARDPHFLNASSLYHPATVVSSFVHDGTGEEPGFKDPHGEWDLRSHRSRIQTVNSETLRLWQDILGSQNWVDTAMVYTVNSAATRTLTRLSTAERLGGLNLQFSRGWDESIDRKKGRFVSEWGEADWEDTILQGPHLYVSTPLYKTPNSTMRHQQDWSATDFEALPADTLPVTAYKPAGGRAEYDQNYTHWTVTDEHGIEQRVAARDCYRVAWRRMAPNTGERTLTPAIVPPGVAQLNTVLCFGAIQPHELAHSAASLSTLICDFTIRSSPKNDIYAQNLERLAMPSTDHPLAAALQVRGLRLNCVTDAYADLWATCWDGAFVDDEPILPRHDERPVGLEWTEDVPLRRALDRRNAQVEIDALVALMLGVPVDDLCTIYRTQFAVLYGYDQREYTYDVHGRLVPNSVLTKWRKRHQPADNSDMPLDERQAEHPGSGVVYTYELPFGTLDREADFRTAYAEFERRLAAAKDRSSPGAYASASGDSA